MKRTFNGQSKTMTIEMDYEDYLNLITAIEIEARRTENTCTKEDFQMFLKLMEDSEYKSIW